VVAAFTTTTTKGEQIPFGNPRLRGLRAPSDTPNKEAHSPTAKGCGSLRKRMDRAAETLMLASLFDLLNGNDPLCRCGRQPPDHRSTQDSLGS